MNRPLSLAVLSALCAASAPLMGSLPAAAQAAACKPLNQIAAIKLTKNDAGQWTLPVGFNTTPSTMLLSLSSANSSISPSGADAAKLAHMIKSGEKLVPSTGKGPEFVQMDAFVMIGITPTASGKFTNNVQFPISSRIPTGKLADNMGGVMGLDTLTNFDFDIDPVAGQLNLFLVDHCEGQVVYWKTSAAVAAPFNWDIMNKMRVPVKLDDQDIRITFDTTSDVNKMTLANAHSLLKFDEKAAGVEKLPDDENGGQVWRTHFKVLSIGGLGIGNPAVEIVQPKFVPNTAAAAGGGGRGPAIQRTPEERKPAELSIGLATMSKLHIYVAAKEKNLYISPASQ